ncbi:NAD(P)H-quinone oxidoreductase subunit L protein [Dioscorea alata]|uniref:NAD(P)H-quinone oxidoreductase subunit L protein n=1 Tax=Dioscorea alata TaxID=55571 RepID=A0ACB7VXN5_DIOAL|nr:NAD(P)H-quinone oxidoreductase subunit L protein [Dioscorea alata]
MNTISLRFDPSSLPSLLQPRRIPQSKHENPKSLLNLNHQPCPQITLSHKPRLSPPLEKLGLYLHCGTILSSMGAAPALAVTGVNDEIDLYSLLVSGGIISFFYFIVMPPIIMNWMRLRWYKRKFVEMYFQFMFVFLFFPGLMLWAPFLNFRKFPRDPTMKYPWSTPNDDNIPLYKDRYEKL